MELELKRDFGKQVRVFVGLSLFALVTACGGGTTTGGAGGFATVDANSVNDEGKTVMPVTVFRNPDRCGAQSFQSYKGQSFVVISSMLPSGYRKIGPNEEVRADYNINRITVEVDARDLILGVYCG